MSEGPEMILLSFVFCKYRKFSHRLDGNIIPQPDNQPQIRFSNCSPGSQPDQEKVSSADLASYAAEFNNANEIHEQLLDTGSGNPLPSKREPF